MKRDTLFQEQWNDPFQFDRRVSDVFDDMATRSIPWYDENLRMCQEIIWELSPKDSLIVDLGCSTGNAISRIIKKEDLQYYRIVGIDQSVEMIDQARSNFQNQGIDLKCVSLFCLDITNFENLSPFASTQCFLLRYTLQFIHPSKRRQLLFSLRDLCKPNGFLLINEKISNPKNSPLLLDNWYHQYKFNNGYSWEEIERKRIALKNVLIPLTIEENISLFKSAGFTKVQTIFQWYNFVSFFVSIS